MVITIVVKSLGYLETSPERSDQVIGHRGEFHLDEIYLAVFYRKLHIEFS